MDDRRTAVGSVLAQITHSHPVTRVQLAEQVGLSRAAVSAATDQLLQWGLIQEVAPTHQARSGRPAVPLIPTPGVVAGVGMSVGADHLGVRAVDLNGRVVLERLRYGDTRNADPLASITTLMTLAHEVVASLQDEGTHVSGLTVALPGFIRADGTVRIWSAARWTELNVLDLLQADPMLDGLAPSLHPQAHLAAAAQARLTDSRTFLYLCGEAQISAALVVDGRVFGGAHGWAGAIGQMTADPSLGDFGTVDRLIGRETVLRAAGLSPTDPIDALLTGPTAQQGHVRDVVRRVGEVLGTTLAAVIHLVDVPEVVLGGWLWQLAPVLAPTISAELQTRLVTSPWVTINIHQGKAGDLPALTGAAWASLDRFIKDPDPLFATPRRTEADPAASR